MMRITEENIRRYIVYIGGLYVFSLGIALVSKSAIGTTSVSSWAYTMSRNTEWTVGRWTFLIHLVMIAYQAIIMYGHGLRRELANIALQIPFSFIFSVFLDINMFLLQWLVPQTLLSCYAVLLIGCAVHSFGCFMEVSGRVTMMSAEATVYYTCERWHLEFGKIKVRFDVFMVSMSILTSLLFNFTWKSAFSTVREGTVINALLVGNIYRFYARHIRCFDNFIHAKCLKFLS